MIKYIFTALLGVLALLMFSLSAKLFVRTRGSRLYGSSSLVGVLASVHSFLYIASLYIESNALTLLIGLVFALVALSMYFLWRTTYNQIRKSSSHVFILFLFALQVLSDVYAFAIPESPIQLFTMISNYHVMSVIVLMFVSILYFRFSKMNNTTHLKFVSLLLLIYTLSQLATVVISGKASYVFALLVCFSMLYIIYFYTEDYKRSYYY